MLLVASKEKEDPNLWYQTLALRKNNKKDHKNELLNYYLFTPVLDMLALNFLNTFIEPVKNLLQLIYYCNLFIYSFCTFIMNEQNNFRQNTIFGEGQVKINDAKH